MKYLGFGKFMKTATVNNTAPVILSHNVCNELSTTRKQCHYVNRRVKPRGNYNSLLTSFIGYIGHCGEKVLERAVEMRNPAYYIFKCPGSILCSALWFLSRASASPVSRQDTLSYNTALAHRPQSDTTDSLHDLSYDQFMSVVEDKGMNWDDNQFFDPGKMPRDRKKRSGSPPAPVITESKKYAAVGKDARLPCEYQHQIYEASWSKGPTHNTAKKVVSMDPFFYVGKRTFGPTIDIDRYNITNDNALIIKNVTKTDSGNYICTISDFQTGKNLRNSTMFFVYYDHLMMHSKKNVTEGSEVQLLCDYPSEVNFVNWTKPHISQNEFTFQDDRTLAYFDSKLPAGVRFVHADRYRLNHNYSLAIHDVTVSDTGRYYCEVTDRETGIKIKNFTDVFVSVSDAHKTPIGAIAGGILTGVAFLGGAGTLYALKKKGYSIQTVGIV